MPTTTTAPAPIATREEWLETAAKLLYPWARDGYRFSVGYPTLTRRGGGAYLWDVVRTDGSRHVYISPLLDESESVLAVLQHALLQARHGGTLRLPYSGLQDRDVPPFSAGCYAALAVGNVLAVMPAYPHNADPVAERRTQSTRMVRMTCPDCGYVARATARWISTGTPSCPCGAGPWRVG